MKQSHFTLIALALIAGGFALAAVFYNAGQGEQASQQAAQHSDLLIRDHSVRAGNPQAKVTIVEFVDPACGTCAQFHPLVKELLERQDGKINLVLRYAPLHQGSAQMVALLEAAKMQGKFWPVLEMMFQTQRQWVSDHVAQPETFWNLLNQRPTGLDMQKLAQDMSSQTVIDAIQQDINDGEKLGANKTPTFFVNGKPLPSFGYEQLAGLVAAEVDAAY